MRDVDGYRETIDDTPNARVAMASFDTYNARDWAGYQALQHPDVEWVEVQGRVFSGVGGVTEEVDNWRDAFPDAQAVVTNLFDCGDDRVVIEWTLKGVRATELRGPDGAEVPRELEARCADLMQLRGGKVYTGRTYYGLRTVQAVLALQGGAREAGVPTPGRFRVGFDTTPNALVGMASFDTYNARDWDGYRALQHPGVKALEVEGRTFVGPVGVTEEVDNFEGAYPDNPAEVMNLVDCGGDRLIIEWTLPGPLGKVRACDLMQLKDGKVFRVRTYYGLRSAEIVAGVQGL